MLRIGLIAASVVLAVGGAADHTQQGPRAAAGSMIAYDDFMKLSADQKRARFGEMNAENRSAIVRAHAERWLKNNRGRLTASEVSVFQELIGFITPERYRRRANTDTGKEEEALPAKMRCRVSSDDVVQAFNVFGVASESGVETRRWTYLSQAKCWVDWIAEDLVDYIPTLRR
jgi:hypothetical protein